MMDESRAPQTTADTPPTPELAAFMAAWSDSMASVLGQIANSPFPVQCSTQSPSDTPPPSETDLYSVITAAGSLRGEMAVRVQQPTVIALGQLFLGEKSDAPAEYKSDYRDAVEELIRQIAGHVASALKPRWGEVQLRVEFGAAPAWPPGAEGSFTSSSEAPLHLCPQWSVSAALVAALHAAPSSERSPEQTAAATGAEHPAPTEGKNLDLLMDVELEVTLRFGKRSMLLREILELGAGSVVELDRDVDEPVDLLLDDKLIARGEVVVVDGDYGLKVLEVMSPRLA